MMDRSNSVLCESNLEHTQTCEFVSRTPVFEAMNSPTVMWEYLLPLSLYIY